MTADSTLATLIGTLATVRGVERGDPALDTFLARVRDGIHAWETVLADFDTGGTATAALTLVADAFSTDPDFADPTREAQEMLGLGVGTTTHHVLVALVPLRRDIARANQRPLTLLRRAAALERRAQRRWKGPEGRAAALVDRDLQLEEVRVAGKALLVEMSDILDGLVHRLA
ncbi:hypothetical protein [Actinokineospora enzanensis]|uniref:hypothetical protein n=1 Tax=Actinokineospora enzanensis TaxID=155975 RepID=UPI00035EBAA7|nr:hypothetical protein [Actinokineospora enzanensis]